MSKAYWEQVFFLEEGNQAQKKVNQDFRKRADAILKAGTGPEQQEALSALAVERQAAWLKAGEGT